MTKDVVIRAVNYDILAALKAFDSDEFSFVNIMGNRTASDLLICGRNDLMVIGYLLREVGRNFEAIKRKDEDLLKESKKHGKKFLTSLLSLVNEEKVSPKEIWDAYYEYENNIRKHFRTPIEGAIYKEDHEFTEKTTSMLVNYLDENRNILLDENNLLVQGLLNELVRVMNVYGLEHRDLVFYLALHSLSGYYEYLLFSSVKDGVIENEKEFADRIFPYVDKITALISKFDPDKPKTYELSNEILGELCSEWRKFFINYMDIARKEGVVLRGEKEKIIPEKAREKIDETIKKALEKKVSGTKSKKGGKEQR